MSSNKKSKSETNNLWVYLRGLFTVVGSFLKKNWIGLVVITAITLVFFGPLLIRASSYSDGGDSMFNAWTLARDQHCILQQNCPNYSDGNIYFPNKDSMLYSETQLSAGFLTLPFYFVNHNPIFSYNMWLIISVLMSGIFMYLLAKFLSKNNEAISILLALVFEFAPLKMTAMGHLQNLSIFYLPLIILLFLKYLSTKDAKKGYLIGAFIAMVLLFYASWYQMVFGLMFIFPLLIGLLITKAFKPRRIGILALVSILAIIATLPLAKEYVRFSKTNNATFQIAEQALFSSSLKDYGIPYSDTLEGKLYYKARPHSQVNSYNPDSSSFHGYSVYLLVATIFIFLLTKIGRKQFPKTDVKLLFTLYGIALLGFVASLGPLLKAGKDFAYTVPGITQSIVIPMPYILVDKFLPQLSFIRAIGRASVIMLLAMLCILAIAAILLKKLTKKQRVLATVALFAVFFFELMPPHQYRISTAAYATGVKIPGVYTYISKQSSIDNIIVIRSDKDYPGAPIPVARAEDTLWAGYHNRNIFNGYSGYEPKQYAQQYIDFVDFKPDDVPKLKALGLDYIIVDKTLSTSNPELDNSVEKTVQKKVYEDTRYVLFKI